MFGPDWKEGFPSCSFNMDHTDAALVHLAQRDVSFAAISRATLPQIETFKKRMGWRFSWVSSNGNDFNRDYNVSFLLGGLGCGPTIPTRIPPGRTKTSRIGRPMLHLRRSKSSQTEHKAS